MLSFSGFFSQTGHPQTGYRLGPSITKSSDNTHLSLVNFIEAIIPTFHEIVRGEVLKRMEQVVEPTDGGIEGQMPPWLLPVAEKARL